MVYLSESKMSDESKYPAIWNLLEIIAKENDLVLLPPDEVIWPDIDDLETWEMRASFLRPDQEEVFALGEHNPKCSAAVIAFRLDLGGLSAFLDEVVDGELFDTFFESN
jgi:hypothetical protein